MTRAQSQAIRHLEKICANLENLQRTGSPRVRDLIGKAKSAAITALNQARLEAE